MPWHWRGLPTAAPFTTAQARAVGIRTEDLVELRQRRVLRRLVRGVYVFDEVRDSLDLRCAALRLVVPPDAVVTDRTAGWLHGAPMILAPNADLDVPPVSVFHRRRGQRLRNPVADSGQRMMSDADVTIVGGLAVTTLERTLLDLGRLLRREPAFAAMNEMLRAGADRDVCLARSRGFAGYRGVRQVRALLPLTDARCESPPESIVYLRWLDCSDLPRPTPQVPVTGPFGTTYSLDLGVEELRFAVEYDGWAWHGPTRTRHDDERRAWISEHGGWHVVVLEQPDVYGRGERVELMLREGLREAARLRRGKEVPSRRKLLTPRREVVPPRREVVPPQRAT